MCVNDDKMFLFLLCTVTWNAWSNSLNSWDFLSQKQGASPFPKALLSFLSPSVIHVADFLLHANENLSQAFLGGTEKLLGISIKIPGIQMQQLSEKPGN